MQIIIGTDHRGFELKQEIMLKIDKISGKEVKIIDIGCYENEEIDFTDVVFDLIDKWNEDSVGILICKTGIGMSICANRFSNIRGAICKTIDDVISARSHNDANVLILGAKNENEDIFKMIDVFLNTSFNDDEKYTRRVSKINSIKCTNKIN
ncbi:RpiB/LacA/LacB family sugar-phosphate isomerase [Candidatus Cytomitobacter indipagum]|uniref:RpiB/LacA/LacB family sugar-phosphate isomerase n=1 Tax=Candidatus Cytomitobacter indipagum TaxID=2601575 RepID=A0A5C0UEC1_9PROT|nr:RpiB/LacA/LacB family sugar-phosphate isomerase [Candidatus Cytomitobacter indipagum]QEK38031.1 RpiB/LacA/LacB family sugar-phosphate isomerase [Candidatus Cytomitobacter indipagum]